jgi:hypothetical protein
MNEPQHPHPSSDKESTLDGELNLRSIFWLTLGLLVILVIAVVAMWFFGFAIKDNLIAEDPPPPALPEARMEHTPPAPNLQADPRQELLDLRAEAEKLLTTYGWVDENNGLTRVPIDRAMDTLIDQGLPSPVAVTETPGEASTGI